MRVLSLCFACFAALSSAVATARGLSFNPKASYFLPAISALGQQDSDVLVEEDFEDSSDGTGVDRLQGWERAEGASGVVQDIAGSEGRALGFSSGDIIKALDSASPDDVSWVEMRIKVRPYTEEPAIQSDTSAAFYFTRRGQLRVNDGGVWKDASIDPINLADWQQIVTKLDYGASPQVWSIWLNGKLAGEDIRFANQVDRFRKITFGNESSANSFLDRLKIGVGEPKITPVVQVERTVEKKNPEPAPVKEVAQPVAEKKAQIQTPTPDTGRQVESGKRVPTLDDVAGRMQRSETDSPSPQESLDSEPEASAEVASQEEVPSEPHPVLPPIALFLLPVAAAAGIYLHKRKASGESLTDSPLIAFSLLGLFGVILFLIFPSVEAAAGRSLFFLAAGWAVFASGFAFWLMRRDNPEEIFIVFRIAPFVGTFGIFLIAVGSIVKIETGIGLLSAGMVLGMAGCWTFAESGFRGSRSFFAGVIASLASVSIILDLPYFAGWILLLSYCVIPLFFGLQDAKRRLSKAEKIRQFELKGDLKRPVVRSAHEDAEDEVVVVRRERKKKKKDARKGPRRSRSTAGDRPVIISRDAEAEGNEEEEEPFFGEGVLATEPGRQGNVRLDPWTGAVIQEGDENDASEAETGEEAPEETDFFDPNDEDNFPGIEPLEEEEGAFDEEELFDPETDDDDNKDERKS